MSKRARRTLLFSALIVIAALCSRPAGGGEAGGFFLAALDLLRDISGLLLLLFVPGLALALLPFRRQRVSFFEWFARGFGINMVLLTAVTTIAKLAGQPMDGRLIVGASLFFLVVAGIVLVKRKARVEVYNDFTFPPGRCLVAIGALFLLLFFCLSGYTGLDPSGHWLIERLEQIDFYQAVPGIAPAATEDLFVRIDEGKGRVKYTNDSGKTAEMDLRLLVESNGPGTFKVSCGGRSKSFDVPQPFIERGREVFFQNHAVISSTIELAPGKNDVELRYEGASGEALPCTYLDFSILDGEAFRKAFLRRYRFVNYVLMYDIMEAEDFVSNLTHYPYIYHSPGTPEMEGYAVTNPPLSYIFSSFGYVLLGEDMAAINKTAYAVLAGLLFVSLYLSSGRPGVGVPMVVGALSLAVVLTLGVSLHFMTHFMFLCTMIAFHFMLEKKGEWFLLFALMACLSAWAGYYFCGLGLLCYALLWRDWKWSIKQFSYITLGLLAFVVCLLSFGYLTGLLGPWLDIMVWENFRRFGSEYLHQAGSKACFFKYALICSGFLPLGLFFRNDRKGYFFFLFSLLYCATLLIAPSNEWKVHYLPTLVFPLMISAARGLTLALDEGKRAAGPVVAAIWLAALCGFIYVLYLALKGELIIC